MSRDTLEGGERPQNTKRWQEGSFYVSSFCNHPHCLKSGKPIGHTCYILNTDDLAEERKIESGDKLRKRDNPLIMRKLSALGWIPSFGYWVTDSAYARQHRGLKA